MAASPNSRSDKAANTAWRFTVADSVTGLIRSATAVDDLLDQIRRALSSAIVPQRGVLLNALRPTTSMAERVEEFALELIDLDQPAGLQGAFAEAALALAQLEDALVDLRRAVSWSSNFSGFNWWLRRRLTELRLDQFVVLPGPGSCSDFFIEKESSVATCLTALERVIGTAPKWLEVVNHVRILTVPQMDGGSPKWHPLSLGHELGHLLFTTDWIEGWLAGLDSRRLSGPAKDAVGIARLRTDPEGEPTRPNWYAQLLSWLIEIACDTALFHVYGHEGIRALRQYLDVHSDTDDGLEHPAPELREAVLLATDHRSLSKYKERSFDNVIARTRKDAFCRLAVACRDAVVDELSYLPYSLDASNQTANKASKLLDRGFTPTSHDWDTGDVVMRPSSVESGLVRSYWSDHVARSPRSSDWRAVVKSRREADTEYEQRIDQAVDFLQFLHRFETARSRAPLDASFDRIQTGPTPGNVLWIQSSGVRGRERQRYGANSVDVRLGRHFIVFRRNRISTLNALDSGETSHQIQDRIEVDWGEEFVLHPGEMILAVTLETLVVKMDATAQVLSRSSLGRLGLLSATAVQVQPGFKGCLTLELVNLASVPLRLNPGQRIAQIVPASVCGTAEPYAGKYQNASSRPRFTAVVEDWEMPLLQGLSFDNTETTLSEGAV